jgi:ribosomal protein S18 acetylase RimI-like enzyme
VAIGSVRPARPEDAAAVAEVHTRSWQGAYEHVFGSERLATISVESRRSWWERCIRERLEVVLVAEDESGSVVAFASAGPDRDDASRGELYAIYALPEAFGRGVGHALMAEVVSTLREAGYAEAVLWVLTDNPRARAFYEREGWALDGGTKSEEWLGLRVDEVRYGRAF